jgi:quercetin dioxygenase-like cupin family protein
MSSAKKSLGSQLKKLLKQKKLSVGDAAEMIGIKSKELEHYLSDKKMPPVAVILRMSRALAIEPDSLIAAGDDQSEQREEGDNLRNQAYGYTMLSQPGKNYHLRSFNVTIPAKTTHRKVVYTHDGEEFIYVLSGQLELTVGRTKHLLEKGDSLHFDSTKRHILSNPGSRANRLLVVVYSP